MKIITAKEALEISMKELVKESMEVTILEDLNDYIKEETLLGHTSQISYVREEVNINTIQSVIDSLAKNGFKVNYNFNSRVISIDWSNSNTADTFPIKNNIVKNENFTILESSLKKLLVKHNEFISVNDFKGAHNILSDIEYISRILIATKGKL